MSVRDEPRPQADDELAEWLAACDDLLARGAPADSIDTTAAPADSHPRVLRDLECVQLLRNLWPRQTVNAGDNHNGDDEVASDSATPQRIGRFEIRRALGEGGYGVVLLAFDPQLGRDVALKIPRAEALVTRELRGRFQYEARIAAGLDHPNIVPVYDAGEVGPICYIASAYCPGMTLAEWLQKRDRPVAFELAAELLAVLADAVQHAHSRGVLHRDLKPGNIILTPRDVSRTSSTGNASRRDFIPRLTDFGLAKLAEAAPAAHTRTGAVLGTPEYMAPEQAAGRTKDVSVATDVYALGAILYELLVGRPPLRGETAVETLRLIESREPTPLSRLRANVPRDLETICLKCLQKEPPRRYLSARDLAEDLHRYLAGEPVEARPVGQVERLWRWCRRNPLESALVAAVALALLAGTIVSTYFGIQAVGRKQAEIDAAIATVEARNAQAATDMAQRHLYLAKMLVAQSAWDEVRIQDLTDALAAVRPEHTLGADYRGFEWHYWNRACNTDLLTVPVTGPAYCVKYSPNGKYLAIAGEVGRLWIVDVMSGRTIHEILAHNQPIWDLSFTSDGARVASASDDRSVRVWNTQTGKLVTKLEGHTADVTSVAFAPDDARIASAAEDGTVRIWSWPDGTELLTYSRHDGPIWKVAFNRDGTKVVSCGDDGAHMWNSETGETIKKFNGHDGPVYCTALNDDETTLATASEDRTIRIWNVVDGETVRVLSGHTSGVRTVQFDSDGQRLLSAGRDDVMRLWNVASGRQIFANIGHKNVVDCAIFSPDGNQIASSSRDATVKVWDATGHRQPRTFIGHEAAVDCAAFNPDAKRIASLGRDGRILFWNAESTELLSHRYDHSGSETKLALHPHGHFLAVARTDHTVRIYDLLNDRVLHNLRGHAAAVRTVAFDRDGHLLASAGDENVILLWDGMEGKLVDRLESTESKIRSVAFSSDGRLVSAGNDGVATLWDLENRRAARTLSGGHGAIYSCAFSPDGSLVATANHDGTAQVWKAADGSLVFTLSGHRTVVNSVAFNGDGSRLATGGLNGRINLWDMMTGQEVMVLKGHGAGVESVAFSSDGQQLVSASLDGTVKVWDGRPLDGPAPR